MSQASHRNANSRHLIVAFAGGGTGGHLYPALAMAEAIRDTASDVRFVFFVTSRSIDRRILESTDCDVVVQDVLPPNVRPWRWPGFLTKLRHSQRICREQFAINRPDVVIGTGGFGSVPAVLEAKRARIPAVVFNPDVLPGRANKFLSRRCDLFIAQWNDSNAHLSPRVRFQALGCPIRSKFLLGDRAAGLNRFDLSPDRKTLLVTGASQGARTINEAVVANLDWLGQRDDWQLIHLTGEQDHHTVLSAYEKRSIRAAVLPFTDHMADAVAASDLVVARAGASTLAELTAMGRASVLMPYPYHRDQHQLANADVLARASAARIVEDRKNVRANGASLGVVLKSLMADSALLSTMAKAARTIGAPDAARKIADRVMELTRSNTTGEPCEMLEAAC